MKIAIVAEHVDTRRGGAETSVIEMTRALISLGADVTLVATGGEGEQPSDLNYHRISVSAASRMGRTREFLHGVDQFCRDARFDVVHAVTPCLTCDVYQPRGGTLRETVSRSVARGGSAWGRLLKRASRRFNARQRFLLRIEQEMLSGPQTPMVAAVSDYVRRQVLEGFEGIQPGRVRVVFNGVAIDPGSAEQRAAWRSQTRSQLRLDENETLLLFAAHNFKLKGLPELFRALAHETHKKWTLAVAGRESTPRWQREAQRRAVGDRVRFLGAVDDMRALYAAADVLVHPTWYDPCSRVVLEALRCGLPVVTTRWNGAAEAVERGSFGVVVDSPADDANLHGAIVNCLAGTSREKLRIDCAQLAEQLSMTRHARELIELYERVRSDPRGISRAI